MGERRLQIREVGERNGDVDDIRHDDRLRLGLEDPLARIARARLREQRSGVGDERVDDRRVEDSAGPAPQGVGGQLGTPDVVEQGGFTRRTRDPGGYGDLLFSEAGGRAGAVPPLVGLIERSLDALRQPDAPRRVARDLAGRGLEAPAKRLAAHQDDGRDSCTVEGRQATRLRGNQRPHDVSRIGEVRLRRSAVGD